MLNLEVCAPVRLVPMLLRAAFRALTMRSLAGIRPAEKEMDRRAVNEDSLLERVTAAAEERHLSQNTLTAYRRTWFSRKLYSCSNDQLQPTASYAVLALAQARSSAAKATNL